MSHKHIRWMVPFLALAALLTFSATADARGTVLETTLQGSAAHAGVSGKAKFKADGGQREFEVEIEDAKPLAGQTLTVTVNGARVGTMRVNSFGSAELERNSRRGQAVPSISRGAVVRVMTASGALVASGTF